MLIVKRYVLPLILPPTPPQLASDKASIDESFSRAFALIDQLTSDTASLKSSEAERTEKLDSTLRDVESVISDLKAANIRREAESRILADQVHGLKEMVPKALDGWKASGDGRLEELATELRSLKKLVGNRMGSTNSQPPLNRTYQGISAKDRTYTGVASIPTMIGGNGDLQENLPGSPAPAPGVVSPKRENAGGYQSSGKATIPAWQMADAGEKGLGGTSGKGESTIADSGT